MKEQMGAKWFETFNYAVCWYVKTNHSEVEDGVHWSEFIRFWQKSCYALLGRDVGQGDVYSNAVTTPDAHPVALIASPQATARCQHQLAGSSQHQPVRQLQAKAP